MTVEGLKGHVATHGSLLGTAGKWAVVQLDHEEMLGMFGSVEAEFEVQRTINIKRAELKAFLCLLERAIGPTSQGA